MLNALFSLTQVVQTFTELLHHGIALILRRISFDLECVFEAVLG
jgi:hypothetical protein